MLTAGAIAGIAIGTICGIALVAALLLFARKRGTAGRKYARQRSDGTNYSIVELADDKRSSAIIAEVDGYSRMGEAPDTNAYHEMHVPPNELHDKRSGLNELPA
jgi:gas vesicle protein